MSYQSAVFLIILMIAAVLGGLVWFLNHLVAKQQKEIEEDGESKN